MDNMDGKRRVILSEPKNLEELIQMQKERRKVIFMSKKIVEEIEKMVSNRSRLSVYALKYKLEFYARHYNGRGDNEKREAYLLLKGKDAYNPITDILLDKNGNVRTVDYY